MSAPPAGPRPRIAFHAPMKPPDHPTPSGDRQIARLTMTALARAGFEVVLASRLRTRDGAGDAGAQARLMAAAEAEVARLRAEPGPRPDLWFTYHSYHKAPDLIGPHVARALGIPYVISEPSFSPRRLSGPWRAFAAASRAALGAADRLFWTTARDRPALEAEGLGERLVHLPAFLDAGPAPAPRPAGRPLRLLTVAMMREGAKAESYARLARALGALGTEPDWRLEVIGDGPARGRVEALLAPLGARVRLRGATDDPAAIRAAMEAADLFLWPGVEEGVGLVWLEAQAAGLPALAEAGPAAREAIAPALQPLPDPGDAAGFAAAIRAAAARREELGRAARAHVETRHSLDAAAALLGSELRALLAGRDNGQDGC